MANLCGTCKHWKKPDASDDWMSDKDYGLCQRIPQMRGGDNPVLGYDDDKETVRNEPAAAQDGSGYFAAVRCRSDFGCVLWEPHA